MEPYKEENLKYFSDGPINFSQLKNVNLVPSLTLGQNTKFCQAAYAAGNQCSNMEYIRRLEAQVAELRQKLVAQSECGREFIDKKVSKYIRGPEEEQGGNEKDGADERQSRTRVFLDVS